MRQPKKPKIERTFEIEVFNGDTRRSYEVTEFSGYAAKREAKRLFKIETGLEPEGSIHKGVVI